MVTIQFNYSGIINGEPVDGNAILHADPATGIINGSANFAAFPSASFTPATVGVSLLSISCVNGAKAEQNARNIIDVTNGLYSSIREVTLFDSSNGFLGHIVINGTFQRVSDIHYMANATVTGNYSGPVDIQFPDGYTMPLVATEAFKLEGSFEKTYSTEDGINILSRNKHTYFFNNGVSAPLADIECVLTYDTQQSYWLPNEKILHLTGTSIVHPL